MSLDNDILIFFIFFFLSAAFTYYSYISYMGPKRRDGIRERLINAKPYPVCLRYMYLFVFLVVIPGSIAMFFYDQWVWYGLYMALALYYFIVLLIYLIYQQRKFKVRMAIYDELSKSLDIFIEQFRMGTNIHGAIKEAYHGTNAPLKLWFQSLHQKLAVGHDLRKAILSSRFIVPRLKYLQYFMIVLIIYDKAGVPIVNELNDLKLQLFEHEKMVRRMNVAVSLAKYAALMTAIVPFAACFLIYYVAQDFIMPFLLNPLGPVIVAFASLLVLIGIYIVFKLTQFNLRQIDGRVCR